MKKLAIICGSLSCGGAERVSIYLADYIRRQGVSTTIITGGCVEKEYKLPEGVKRIILSRVSSARGKNVFSLIYMICKLQVIIKEHKFDTVLIMGVPLCIYAIPGCLGNKVKVVVSERNAPTHFAGRKAVGLIARTLMKLADGFVFQTEEARAFYIKNKKIEKYSVIIFNPLLVENLPTIHKGERKKQIVSAGRLNSQKNHMLLIDSFALVAKKYPEYRLIIYGEGEMRKQLEKKCKSINLEDRVIFPGNVTDLFGKICSASMFVMSSDFEGMPNALIEAMALGLPCIATDCPCGGPKSLIKNGINGILVPIRDAEKMAEAMELLVTDPIFAESIGNKAAEISTMLSIQTIGEQWIDYLNRY